MNFYECLSWSLPHQFQIFKWKVYLPYFSFWIISFGWFIITGGIENNISYGCRNSLPIFKSDLFFSSEFCTTYQWGQTCEDDSMSGMHQISHNISDLPSSVRTSNLRNVHMYSSGHPSPPLLTGLWRELVSWHGATPHPAWRSTRWYRTGWMRPCSGSSWSRSETGCLGSGYGSGPPRMLCGVTGGLTWGRQWERSGVTVERLYQGQKDRNTLWKTEVKFGQNMTGWEQNNWKSGKALTIGTEQ